MWIKEKIMDADVRWISDKNRNRNKLAYFIKLCYFYNIEIAKLCICNKLAYLGFIHFPTDIHLL